MATLAMTSMMSVSLGSPARFHFRAGVSSSFSHDKKIQKKTLSCHQYSIPSRFFKMKGDEGLARKGLLDLAPEPIDG